MRQSTSDEQLMQNYCNGDNKAFEILYSRYKNSIYHYFYRQVETSAIADELHQDVWLKIIKSSSQFSEQSSLKTWLFTIAHNRLVDYYRHKQVIVAENKQSSPVEQIEQEHFENNFNPVEDPGYTLHASQLKELLSNAIANLPREQKDVFILYEQSGLSLKDIAYITGNSFESTKSRLRYAVKKLRQHFALNLVDNDEKN